MTASGCNATLSWSTGATGSSITVSAAGTYRATCTNSCGSTNSNNIVISIINSPTSPMISANKQQLCGNEVATLIATGCGGTIKWSTGVSGSSTTVNTPGTYTANCINACGTSEPSNIVTIFSGGTVTPPVIATTKTELCGTETTTLTASGCSATIKWNTGATGSSIVVGSAGTYNAVCETSCGTSSASNVITIKTGTSPVAPVIAATKTELCVGQTTTLTASGCNATLSWSTGATGSSITVSAAGTYRATCTNSCGSANSNIISITTGNIPNAPTIVSNKTSICGNETATLTASGCVGSLSWNTGATASSIVAGTAGTYTATCINTCGASAPSNLITITTGIPSAAPTITSSATTLCSNETATLIASGCNSNVVWSNASTGTSIIVSVAGTYSAKCVNNCGESTSSNVIIIKTQTSPVVPTVQANATTICGSQTATLIATGCTGNLTWSTGATTSSISVSAAGTYSAICTNECGESLPSTGVVIRRSSSPSAPIISTNKTSLCGTETAILSATECLGTVNWNNGTTGTSITVSSAGTYSATCTSICGTSSTSNILTINSGGTPSAPVIAATKTNLCGTETATLTATGCGGTVKWNTNATGSSITISVAGTYTANCINSCGTSLASNAIIIKTGNTPTTPVITTNKNSICANETATLTATACNGSLIWSTNATTTSITVSVAGTYTAVCSNDCGISPTSNVVLISTGTNPSAPSITANKTSLCGTETATLTATGCSGTVSWTGGATGTSLTVGTAGTYTATCTNSCGTSGVSNAIVITTGGTPSAPSITANKTSLCGTETATLTATGCSGTVSWTGGATGTSLTVGTAGTYTATCTNSCGTSGVSNAIVITTGGTPSAPSITANKTSLCGTETATLTATGCSGTVSWTGGATGTSLTVGTAGTYTATCITSCGTSGISNAIVITTGGNPSAPLISTNKPSLCGSETSIITATGCSGTVSWTGGSTGTSITVSTAGTYTATCTNSCGTSGVSNAVIITTGGNPAAPVISTDKTSLCGTETATLTATGCSGTVTWTGGNTGTSLTVNTAGTYTATCTNVCGISVASNQVVITTGGTPSAPTISTEKTTICQNETTTLIANGCSGVINWSNGSTGSSIAVSTAGTYTATCTNACGTSVASNTIAVVIQAIPTAPIITANKTSICATETAILTASGCNGPIIWTGGTTGTILTVNSAGTYTAVCSNACSTSGASNTIIITTKTDCGTCSAVAPVITASKTNICKPENVTLTAAGCSTGTVIWSTGQTGTSVTVKPTATTLYTAVCKESNVCSSSLSNGVQVRVENIPLPSLVCLKDFVCDGEPVVIKASGCEGIVVWSTGATGASITLIPDSTVKYTAKCKVGECESGITEPVMIPFGSPNKPFISCKKQICAGESTSLSATGCTGIVVWSTGATGAVLTVTPTTEFSTYWAKCRSLSGKCESERSNEVTITVGKQATAPTVIAEIRNVCPFNTADLNTAILSEISTVGGQFEFHTTNSPSSPLITNPGAVGAGTYYIFERTAAGCYTAGSVVKVTITNCEGGVNPSAPLVDLAISKKAMADKVELNQEVEYKVWVKNVGQTKATGIEVRDILPYKLSFMSGSANATYTNGVVSLKLDSLKAGDSTSFTYKTRVVAGGKVVNKAELAKVNEVDNTFANNVSEYTINDPAKESVLLGLSKVSGTPVLNADSTYRIPFTIYVKNMGNADATGVQVIDDLEKAFGNGAKILNDTVKVVADSGLVVNPHYTGRGLHKEMLIDSLSTIKKGATAALRFNVKLDLKNASTGQFYNKAELIIDGQKKEESTDGINPDPDHDGDPTNNGDPTPIEVQIDINNPNNPNAPLIGVSLSIVDSLKIDQLSYSVTYLALVKNLGNVKLTNVQVSDSISKTFADSTSYEMVGKPSLGINSTLKLNPNFNGKEDANLLIADTTSQLAVSKMDSIFYTVKVYHNNHAGPYQSYAYAKAIGNGLYVSDISNSGMLIKPNETSPTLLTFPINYGEVVIPEAFSPNDDGENDFFKVSIPKSAKLLSGNIYNRWGHLVYKDKDNVLTGKGWDGTSNQGIRFGSEGLPDGTYYYAIDYELGGTKVHKVGYITLAR
ncbi:gliding motility-associated C-terminal domain-containing protein [Emticicia sp. 17c]|uniref:T9SS type B sorting domain-containing protein n=1 Tax=Emticicia sp. 17c TaxID=3127704 RepID=UPI00301CBC63